MMLAKIRQSPKMEYLVTGWSILIRVEEGFPVTVTYDFRLTQYFCTQNAMSDGINRRMARAAPPFISYIPTMVK